MPRKTSILSFIVLTLLLTGCSNAQVQPVNADYGTPTTLYTAGQTAKMDYCEITVNNFSTTKDSQKGKDPALGNQFAVVSLTIKNSSQESYPYSQDNFTLDIPQQHQAVTAELSDTDYFAGTLKPGENATGSIVFEIPEKESVLMLMFMDLSPGYNGLAQFRLK